MKSLSGVFLREEVDQTEIDGDGSTLYLFILIFPNKRSQFYFKQREEKQKWVEGIKRAIEYSNVNDFYELGSTLGQGKYGVVKQAIH